MLRRLRAPEDGPNPGLQLIGAERLGEVIVRQHRQPSTNDSPMSSSTTSGLPDDFRAVTAAAPSPASETVKPGRGERRDDGDTQWTIILHDKDVAFGRKQR